MVNLPKSHNKKKTSIHPWISQNQTFVHCIVAGGEFQKTTLKLTYLLKSTFSFGNGNGKPGPVYDWNSNKTNISRKSQINNEIGTDETGGFGKDFDPLEWT